MVTYSGLWNGEHGEDHSLLINKSSLRKRVSLLFRQRGNAVLKELMLTLNGASAGSTALAQRTCVEAIAMLGTDSGGVQSIETVDLVNRVTTAADKADIDSVLVESREPTYPTDASGNGGGAKVGI